MTYAERCKNIELNMIVWYHEVMAKRATQKAIRQLDELPKGSDVLTIRYVALSTIYQWDRNYKKHDIGGVIASIKQHGFKDPFKFEPTLNDGQGGVVEGNGRTEALREWKRLHDEETKGYKDIPRGILEIDGEWYAPMLFGVDAPSQAAAEAYAIDHNNLTMMGGDFGLGDVMKMWEGQIFDVLLDMPIMPASLEGVSKDMLDMISKGIADFSAGGSADDASGKSHVFRVRVLDDKMIEEVGQAISALIERRKWKPNVIIEA